MKFQQINNDEYQLRLNKILPIAADKNKSDDNSKLLNLIVINNSKNFLQEHGKQFDVSVGKADRRKFKLGMCYSNAARLMYDNNLNYVEGYIQDTKTGDKVAHAWNCDNEGNHFDFTLKSVENKSYFGIVVPKNIVFEVGLKNFHIWYCCLPFLEIVKEDL
jgi:hypothetical protein